MKGGDGYTVDEPTQGSVAMYIGSGTAVWCAAAPARTSGGSTAHNDHPGLFVAEPKTPAPPVCPPFP